jgi:hypothetical protein
MSTKSTRSTTRSTPRPASKAPARKPASKAASARKPPRKTVAKPAPLPPAPTGSKQSQLIAMLRSPAGGTIEQLTLLTGWQAHSVRGVISGALRKRLQLNVVCAAGSAGTRVYRIVEAAA